MLWGEGNCGFGVIRWANDRASGLTDYLLQIETAIVSDHLSPSVAAHFCKSSWLSGKIRRSNGSSGICTSRQRYTHLGGCACLGDGQCFQPTQGKIGICYSVDHTGGVKLVPTM